MPSRKLNSHLLPMCHYTRVTFSNRWFCQIIETPYQVSTAALNPGRLTHHTHRWIPLIFRIFEFEFLFQKLQICQSLSVGDILLFFHDQHINSTYLIVYPTLICILIHDLAFYVGTGRTSAFRIICDNSCQRFLYVPLYAEISHEQPSAVVTI